MIEKQLEEKTFTRSTEVGMQFCKMLSVFYSLLSIQSCSYSRANSSTHTMQKLSSNIKSTIPHQRRQRPLKMQEQSFSWQTFVWVQSKMYWQNKVEMRTIIPTHLRQDPRDSFFKGFPEGIHFYPYNFQALSQQLMRVIMFILYLAKTNEPLVNNSSIFSC